MAIDSERALAKVMDLRVLVEAHRDLLANSERYYSDEGREISSQIRQLVPVVALIAKAVDPTLASAFVELPRRWEWRSVWDGLERLKGLLEHEHELAEILGVRGPQVSAESLHEWVWSAAASLWDDGYRREAIQAAATQIDIHTSAKLGRTDLSGADLMLQAWAVDQPRRSTQRLRFSGLTPGTDSFNSAHEGAKFFGAGCMLAIRNLTTHSVDQPDEQAALESLAALSVLARWVEMSVVETVEPSS